MDDFTGHCWLWGLSSHMTFIAAALCLPTNLGLGHSWLFPASSMKFLTRRSLKSRWAHLAPHEGNSIELLSTVRSIRWKENFMVQLKLCQFIRYCSCWSYDENCQCTPCVSCTTLHCEVSWGGCCCHKNFLLLVVGLC